MVSERPWCFLFCCDHSHRPQHAVARMDGLERPAYAGRTMPTTLRRPTVDIGGMTQTLAHNGST